MCGIIGVLGRPTSRPVPGREELLGLLDDALGRRHDVASVTAKLRQLDELLHGVPGVSAPVSYTHLTLPTIYSV